MKKYTNEEIEKILKDLGLRVTDHRVLIFKTLSKSRNGMSVEEIFQKVDKRGNIDQATVYRNLSSLVKVGLIRKTDFNLGKSFYELEQGIVVCRFVCSVCHQIEKTDNKQVVDSLKKIYKNSKKFKNTTLSSVEFYGVCKKCV